MPTLLDLFCCQGGASVGYAEAGFTVEGVDIAPQPRYPFPFHQADAIEWARADTDRWDAFHASPPCQLYSITQKIQGNDHPDLIGPTRDFLESTGKPYVIENVEAARPELRNPVLLCGAMFGLRTYRHRLFEANFPIEVPAHPEHIHRTAKMGRRPLPNEHMHVVGNFSDADLGRQIMGMPWATRDGLREAIPPVYATWVGQQLLNYLVPA